MGNSQENKLVNRAQAYLAEESSPGYRSEIASLLKKAEMGDEESQKELAFAVGDLPKFGTAGIRAKMAGGYAFLNQVTVAKFAYGLSRHLASNKSAKHLVMIGYDARKNSKEFARAITEILMGANCELKVCPMPIPTPLLAFALKTYTADIGIMVTASHNPKEDNGIKVFGAHGAQIIAPEDVQIERYMNLAPSFLDIGRAKKEDVEKAYLPEKEFQHLESSYCDQVFSRRWFSRASTRSALKIIYTPIHGVGGKYALRLLERLGLKSNVSVVVEQFEPSGDFETAAYPNPEDPKTMKWALSLAAKENADLIIANDPDADRLAVTAFHPRNQQWQALSGNQIGTLLGAWALEKREISNKVPLVGTTFVSSPMLKEIAKAAGAQYMETLTGFSRIMERARQIEKERKAEFLFGYEEALGFCIGNLVADKDGLSALMHFVELAVHLNSCKQTVFDELERLYRKHGLFVSSQKAILFKGQDAQEKGALLYERIAKSSPFKVNGKALIEKKILGPKVVGFYFEGGLRVVFRPSGTEPKVKFYFDLSQKLAQGDHFEKVKGTLEKELTVCEKEVLGLFGL